MSYASRNFRLRAHSRTHVRRNIPQLAHNLHFVLILTFNFHEPTSTDFTCEDYLSACNWLGGGTKEGGGSRFRFERKQGEKSNVVEKGTREGQSSQSLGHSQYGSLWCNRDAEAPCFCAFGVPFPDPPTNRRSPSFPLSPPGS